MNRVENVLHYSTIIKNINSVENGLQILNYIPHNNMDISCITHNIMQMKMVTRMHIKNDNF